MLNTINHQEKQIKLQIKYTMEQYYQTTENKYWGQSNNRVEYLPCT